MFRRGMWRRLFIHLDNKKKHFFHCSWVFEYFWKKKNIFHSTVKCLECTEMFFVSWCPPVLINLLTRQTIKTSKLLSYSLFITLINRNLSFYWNNRLITLLNSSIPKIYFSENFWQVFVTGAKASTCKIIVISKLSWLTLTRYFWNIASSHTSSIQPASIFCLSKHITVFVCILKMFFFPCSTSTS